MKAAEVLAALAVANQNTKVRGRRRRVVLRFGAVELAEVDALRHAFPNASRAALVRALVLIGVTFVKETLGSPPAAPEAAP